MPQTTILTADGKDGGKVDLAETLFDAPINEALIHQAVLRQLAGRRLGTSDTLTRGEVNGGGKKPWRQKGTGRARQGSTRAPHWVGGGVALGPKPRSYAQKTPKKMIQLALRSALSDRASEGKVLVVDGWSFDEPKTKIARVALETLGTSGRVLAVVGRDDVNASKSLANLPNVHVCQPGELNTHDVLDSDWLVFTRDTVPGALTTAPKATTPEEGAA